MEVWWGGYMDRVVGVLAEAWSGAPEAGRSLNASLRLMVDFHTWRVLNRSGLSDRDAAQLATRLLSGVGGPAPAAPR